MLTGGILWRRRHWRRLVYTATWRLQNSALLASRTGRRAGIIVALVAITLIASWLVPGRRAAATSSPAPAAHVVTNSTDHPSEAAVPATYQSGATGTEPASLSLPSIGATGFIQKVGVDQHRQVAVPTNIHLAGWFVQTVTPGNLGLSIIDGHVDGYRKPGIFAALGRLKVGDAFTVTLANAAVRHFRVVSVQSLPTNQAAAALFSQTPGITRELNLITCGGTFNTGTGYDHRIVIAATFVR